LNYTIRNFEISNKRFSTVLHTASVCEREILADNLLFILILNNFPENVRAYMLYHSLCNHKRIAWGCRGCGRIPNAENLAILRAKIFNV